MFFPEVPDSSELIAVNFQGQERKVTDEGKIAGNTIKRTFDFRAGHNIK